LRIFRNVAILSALLVVVSISASGCFGGSSRPLGWSGVAVSGNEIYFGTTSGKLISLNKDTGTVRWQVNLEGAQGIYGTPVVFGDTVYVTGYGGRVYAVNTSGALKWTSPTTEDVKLPDAVISGLAINGGRLYYGSTDGYVYAVDATSGAGVWSFKTSEKIWATPIVDEGVVYVGSFDKKFYALSAADGRQLWNFEAGGVFTAAAVISGNTIVIGSLDRSLYGLDRNTGAEKWRFTADKWFWGAPVIVGDRVFAPNTDGRVYILATETGAKEGEIDLADAVASTPASGDGLVVAVTENGSVSVIDAETLQSRGLFDLETTMRAPIAASGDIIFIHSQTNETIFAFNTATGARLWEYRAP